MNFSDAKRHVVEALQSGQIKHEPRADADEKNWLFSRRISREEAAEIIKSTRGDRFQTDKHHLDSSIEVLFFRPGDWYIKCYLRNECWFISFHKAGDFK